MKAQVAVFLHYLESRDIDLDPNRTLEIGHMEMIDDIKLSLEARNKQMGLELAQTKEKLSEHEDIRAQHETMISDLKDDLERQSKTLEKLEGDLVTASRTLPGQDDADKFLEIIVSQRDRMKERCDQLAMEVDLARMKLEDADSTRQKLEEENLALFEKAKYMEHWAVSRDSTQMGQPNPHRLNPPGNRAPKLGRLGCGPAEVPLVVEGHLSHANGPRRRFGCFGPEQETAAEAGTLGTVEEKYSRAYAEKLNPFQQFTDLERQKQVRRLGLGDRVAFMMGKMIGSHAGRIFLVVYIMLLHFFVFALVMTTII